MKVFARETAPDRIKTAGLGRPQRRNRGEPGWVVGLVLLLAWGGLAGPLPAWAGDEPRDAEQVEPVEPLEPLDPVEPPPPVPSELGESLPELELLPEPEPEPEPVPSAPPLIQRDRAVLPEVFRSLAPASIEDLKAMELHLQELLEQVSAAVVAVQVGSSTGSGVVISEDGMVLTAAHVSSEPNRPVFFTFPDGRTARGVTLGTDHAMDSGLMKINSNGAWPYAPLGNPAEARLGDWVLGLGHPGGFDPRRSFVVRLGRLIRISSGVLQTDCTLSAGDSGGPLFDMHGRVIGIHSRISDSTAGNFHVPVGTYLETWDRLARGESWGRQRPPARSYVGAFPVDDPLGCRIERLQENGPAFRAGLQDGDVVVRFNGHETPDASAFREQLGQTEPGSAVLLEVLRDGQELSFQVQVDARPPGRWRGPGR